MRDLELGRMVRALRRRRGWRQSDCAEPAGVHRSTWSNLERGHIGQMAVNTLRRCLAVLEIRLDLVPRWRGADLDRVLDEDHARLATAWSERLGAWGWVVRAEVSFSRYGERGRIDLLAWHPRLRILLVFEIKTEIVDVQALLGGLDVKTRLGPHVARTLGWGMPAAVVPVLLVSDRTPTRDRVRRFGSLFAGFALRGRDATSWLRRMRSAPPSGLLIFSDLRAANGRSDKSLGHHRVRSPRRASSVVSTAGAVETDVQVT